MITRFAPSLTGYLHLGHVLHMLYVWGIARKRGAKVLFRIEDHDRSRARPEYETAVFQTLEWLGFFPDLGISSAAEKPSEFRQSDGSEYYQSVLDHLENRGLVYGCQCSRKQIAETQPEGAGELLYSGTCAEKGLPLEGNTVRFRTPGRQTGFEDLKLGRQCQIPWLQCGDFSLRDRQGQWTYQFACVCDDIRHGVDLVIRGEDILFSTARQIQLFETLDAAPPQYYHHPLICDETGRKLSKRQRSESITQLRESGLSPEAVIGRALHQSGLSPSDTPFTAEQAIHEYII
ncbi:glutamate--tRNA ligase family protein [Pontiella agarivorans]|uniref:Glutamate--tRNA ligase family protein n=1 Tax=Pontiella agarivorans TaxID=3038953 RepID=A0ABU5MVU7_9BACT|nr:glutamate--tRNA ligase family protein [Pontiella agarivorans]MDZ8118343.1 glutamate--tRNA ligase family protein [Pontiella agarivorans]